MSSASSQADGLTINVFYSANSLQAKLSDGTMVVSGTVLPPGPYSMVVYDSGDDPNPDFTVSGPGATVSSNLNPTGMQIEVPMTFGPFVFQPSSTYAIFDANMDGGPRISFTTSATGSSASGSSGPGGSPPSPTGPPGSSGPSSSAPATAKLALSLDESGKTSLTIGTKPVKTLKAGRYSIVVGDLSRKAGLLIGHGSTRPLELSGVAAVGTRLRAFTLTRGTWFFGASSGGPKHYFTVR